MPPAKRKSAGGAGSKNKSLKSNPAVSQHPHIAQITDWFSGRMSLPVTNRNGLFLFFSVVVSCRVACPATRLRDTVLTSGGPDRHLNAKYATKDRVV